jgi:hypothetical protein
MLTMHPEQMTQFANAAYKDFENRMVAHLREFFRDRCEALTETGVRDEIRYGVRRARVYGFESELDACRYIDLMFALGSDFDADPNWVALQNTLQDRKNPDTNARMNRLYEKVLRTIQDTDNRAARGA